MYLAPVRLHVSLLALVLPLVGLSSPTAVAQSFTDRAQQSAERGAERPAAGQGNEAFPAAQPPQLPLPPLSPQQQAHLDQVLNYWQAKTEKIERYRSDFRRWQFNSKEAPPNVAITVGDGVIRYMKPDHAVFRVDQVVHFQGLDANNQPQYQQLENSFGEFWVCDGKTVQVRDRNKKVCEIVELPPEMQGTDIFNSPLPFVFGVQRDKVLERFWVRTLDPPPGPDGKPLEVYVIEAFPKYQEDAVNYKKVQVFLDGKDFLPASLAVFLPNWRPDNDQREVFEFTNREAEWSMIDRIRELNLFRERFIPREPGGDWKVIRKPYEPPAENPPRVALPESGGQRR